MNKFEKNLIDRYKNMIMSSKLQNYTLEDGQTLFEYFTGKKSEKIKGNYHQFMMELLNHFFGNKFILSIDFILNNKELLKNDYGNCNAITGMNHHIYIPLSKYIEWLEKRLENNSTIVTKIYHPSFFSRSWKMMCYDVNSKTSELVYVKSNEDELLLKEFKELLKNNNESYNSQDLIVYDKLLEIIKKEG